ncbi:5-oxoprolinase subunit PxpB [Ammoniphilus sp. CFH 90114]|uniref:5-oxoprolinase subunit PxpB n=1 Tax=Ammoniphilus sp. CFH 90114 TaxID=2493665 RepID=UPI00100ED18D|nr:5-oxoprolinase subunit PxpB [Ammoniphilus sp. CFH 90114]RXT04934.1 5-oxoprolinase subunit PxpB [Ammoniphilus sp. CFH 90114]
MNYQVYPLGETALVVALGDSINLETHNKVKALAKFLDEQPFTGLVEYVPAFTTVTVFYDPLQFADDEQVSAYKRVSDIMDSIMNQLKEEERGNFRVMEIPVCYGGRFGPDLEFVAEHNGLTPEEVVEIHTSGEYLVYMIGFAPGFPYIGGMSERIAAPRRPSPRLAIPAGSVGIAGKQTGVYPIETPGGWQLIGQTPLQLFRPLDSSPSLLQAGDQVRFVSVTEDEFLELKGDLI